MRYQKKDDCYFDEKTGLEWSLESSGPMTWKDAIEFCANLGGIWRLPSIEELSTLVDYSKFNPATKLQDIKPSDYWSSTTNANDTDFAWGVDFYYGYSYGDYKSHNLYVRAVRGEPEWI